MGYRCVAYMELCVVFGQDRASIGGAKDEVTSSALGQGRAGPSRRLIQKQ